MNMDTSANNIIEYQQQSLIPLINQFTQIQNKNILDFGCGEGESTFALSLENARCIGVDISNQSIQRAQHIKHKKFKHLNIEFKYLSDTTNLPFEDNFFDFVVCNAVFEHIFPNERYKHFKEIFRVVKKNGYIVIRGTPNKNFIKDSHTTELWLVPWMPLWLAKPYVILRNGAIKKTDGIATQKLSLFEKLKIIQNDEWLRRGIRGLSYKDIRNWIKACSYDMTIINNDPKKELQRYISNSCSLKTKQKKVLQKYIRPITYICEFLKFSVHNFLPYINIMIKLNSESFDIEGNNEYTEKKL